MFSTITLFVFGFVLLLKGADILTDAAAGIAKKLKVANFIIGVVVVGIGTSIPEFVIAIFSHLGGATEMSLGTVVGSNIFNIFFILGVASLLYPLALTPGQVWRHLPINVLAIVAVGIVALNDNFFGLTRLDGILLLFLFILWIVYLHGVNKYLLREDHSPLPIKLRPTLVNIALIFGSIIGIVIGGEWVTESSLSLVRSLGLSEAAVGLTIVGIGTSLPELFASVVAAYKKNYGIALGNVIGSNIFDFFMILGTAAIIKPFPFTSVLLQDIWIGALAALLLFVAIMIGKKYKLERWEGAVFVALYILYLFYLIFVRS